MKKILLLLLGALLTPQVVFGAVEYQQSGLGVSWDISSPNGYSYYIPANISGVFSFPADYSFFTTTNVITSITVKRLSGSVCSTASSLTGNIREFNSPYDYYHIDGSSGISDGNNCIYSLTSSIPNGKVLDHVQFTSNLMMIDGSFSNTGKTFLSSNYAIPNSNSGGFAFALCSNNDCGNAFMHIVDTTTRFDFTIPSATSTPTVATTTSVGAQVYINPADYQDGMYLDMAFFNHGYFSIGAPSAYEIQYGDKHIELPITASSTVLNLATTTTFSLIGNTNAVYRIRKPLGVVDTILDWWGFSTNSNILLEKNFNFTVATSTGFDQTYQQNLDTINSYTQGTSTPIVNCGIVTFNLSDCIVSLFIPNNEILKKDLGTMRDTVLVRAPIGYVTRFVNILTSTSTAPLPIVTITFTPDSPMRPYPTTFDMGDMFTGGANLLNSVTDPNTGKNAHDIFLPLVQLGVAISVLLTIVSDIMKMHNHSEGSKKYT